jgi:hypothetical protein
MRFMRQIAIAVIDSQDDIIAPRAPIDKTLAPMPWKIAAKTKVSLSTTQYTLVSDTFKAA